MASLRYSYLVNTTNVLSNIALKKRYFSVFIVINIFLSTYNKQHQLGTGRPLPVHQLRHRRVTSVESDEAEKDDDVTCRQENDRDVDKSCRRETEKNRASFFERNFGLHHQEV